MILLSCDMDLVYLHASVSFLVGLKIACQLPLKASKGDKCHLRRVSSRGIGSRLVGEGFRMNLYQAHKLLHLGSLRWKFAFGSLEPRSSKKLWREWNLAAIRCEIRMECLVQKATVGNQFSWKVSRREVGKQWQQQGMANALFTACVAVSQTI